jgi:hypothetical protein
MKSGARVGGLLLALGWWTTPLFGQGASQIQVPMPPAASETAPQPAAAAPKAAAVTPAPQAPATPQPAGAAATAPGPLQWTMPTFTGGCADGNCLGTGEVRKAQCFFSAEYLLWWAKQDKVPVLASTSSNPFDNGILGAPTTDVLFGGGGIHGGPSSGFALSAGYWFDDCCKEEGVFVRGFWLGLPGTDFTAGSSEFPTLARPFFNVNQGIEFAELTAFPGRFTGSINVQGNGQLFGTEVNGLCCLCSGCNYRFDFYGGFRYADLQESLTVDENFQGLATAPAPYTNTSFVAKDFFSTNNEFFGGQIGLYAEYDRGPFSLEVWGQVAIGDTHQEILIDGSQLVTQPNGTEQRFAGDLLAVRSNIGHYHQDRFSVIPELDLNIGYQLTSHLRAYVGYDVLYWNNVVRPGGQIDRNVDVTLIPNFALPGVGPAGQNQPSAPRPSTDFWAQGVSFGFEMRF